MNKVKDNSTKEFTINELAAIESNIVIFRSCPDISFTTANEINLNYGLVKAAITKHQDKMEVLKERNAAIEADKENDFEKYKAATESNKQELVKLFTDKHKLNISVTPVSTFANVDISGDKVVKQQDGTSANFAYRDAYFVLLECGLIG